MKHSMTLFLTMLVLAACSNTETPFADKFASLDPDWIVTAEESYEWASVKNANLPTFTGSPEWLNYMAFLEEKLTGYGAVDVMKNSWSFERWDTSDDSADWSMRSDGAVVRVSIYHIPVGAQP